MRRSQRVPVERRALPTRERLRKAGRDVERGDTGAVTLRDSPLERAFLRRAISQEQYCAGQKHRHHWYHGGLSDPLRSLALDRVPAGPDAFSGMAVSERQAFHRQRHREAVAAVLTDYLAVTKVIWLEHGFDGDLAGGHVDNVACFVRPGVVMALSAKDPNDANCAGLQANLARLRGERDAQGREIEVIEVEQPAARRRPDGQRLTTSYLNFYLANGAVVLPMFNDPMDDAAFKAISSAFPDRQPIQLDAFDLAYGGGGIHRITQQQPAPAPPG